MNHLKLLLIFLLHCLYCTAQDTLHIKNVEAILYTGDGFNQPLIVGLGGSEGGNAWASNHWKKTRDGFTSKGYAFLAIGYFGCKGTSASLDRIAIDDIHQAIVTATKNKKINAGRVTVIGGSRGADLALLLGAYYPDINCVIALSASHAVFPGNTQTLDHSSWTFAGKELPFVPVNEAAVPFLLKRDLKGAFETMLTDTAAEKQALIPVEKIQGPVLLMAARSDEIIPAVSMSQKMATRLQGNHFKFHYEVKIYDGLHSEPMNHMEDVFNFLEKYFLPAAQPPLQSHVHQ